QEVTSGLRSTACRGARVGASGNTVEVREKAIEVVVALSLRLSRKHIPLRQFRPGHEAQLADLARHQNLKTLRRNTLLISILRRVVEMAISTDWAIFSRFWPRSMQEVCRVGTPYVAPWNSSQAAIRPSAAQAASISSCGCLPPAGFYWPVLRGATAVRSWRR